EVFLSRRNVDRGQEGLRNTGDRFERNGTSRRSCTAWRKKKARTVFTARAKPRLIRRRPEDPFGRGTGGLRTNRTDRKSKLPAPAPTPGSGWWGYRSRITFGSLI